MSRCPVAALLAFWMMGSNGAFAQEPPKPQAPVKSEDETKGQIRSSDLGNNPIPKDWPKSPAEIKPTPPVAIPDDPPPHEGALIDLPVTIEPPDIIDIEVLEALPGRPITGEYLVKPDGTITLGFYGDIHVRGLTSQQVKIKVILHLLKYMTPEVLGLTEMKEKPEEHSPGGSPFELSVPPGRSPSEMNSTPRPPFLPDVVPPELFRKPEAEPKPADVPKGSATASNSGSRHSSRSSERSRGPTRSRQDRRAIRRTSAMLGNGDAAPQDPQPGPAEAPLNAVPRPDEGSKFEIQPVHPADSLRVFVEITSFNTKVYYVQGDVGAPGRLPWTGKDTVLDALNYAGGFVGTADPEDIHLYRPARGGKPANDYKIDHKAILRGVASANLQMFPDDRLVIGRNATVK
jgi:protein involved in polysaccharide export with SLBB domain